jgi:hypothetical protein
LTSIPVQVVLRKWPSLVGVLRRPEASPGQLGLHIFDSLPLGQIHQAKDAPDLELLANIYGARSFSQMKLIAVLRLERTHQG